MDERMIGILTRYKGVVIRNDPRRAVFWDFCCNQLEISSYTSPIK